MKEKIKWMVLIDFSEYSNVLIKFTERMLKLKELDIILIHQVYGMAPALTDTEIKIEILEFEKQRALKKLKSLTENETFKNAKYIVSNKPLINLINEQSSKNSINIVISGLKGTGVLKQILIGSTIAQIVNELDTITIAIPLQKEIFIPEKFIVATHYNFPLNIKALQQILNVFETVSAIEFITVLNNNEKKDECQRYISEIQQKFTTYKTDYKFYEGDDVFTEIKNHMLKNKCSFLIAQQGSRTLKDAIFRKFMINELVYDGETPLIILPQ